jgi:hypothetical protein
MGHPGFSGKRGVQRDAFASGKRRNAPEKPGCPTGGRLILSRGVVAHLCRCAASPCGARLATTQNHAVKVIKLGRNML